MDVVEHRRRAAWRPSSQNVWQRYIPRLPSPAKPSRSRSRSAASTRSLAHAVLAQPRPGSPRAEVGAHPAARQPVAVVGVDQQPADAVASWSAIGRVLLGGVPAGQRHRHRVVGRRQRDLVQRPVAQRERCRCTARPAAAGALTPPEPTKAADATTTTTAPTTATARRRGHRGAGPPALTSWRGRRRVDRAAAGSPSPVDEVDAGDREQQRQRRRDARKNEDPGGQRRRRAAPAARAAAARWPSPGRAGAAARRSRPAGSARPRRRGHRPEPARIQPAVRRSPRNASQTAPAAACARAR